MLIFEIEDKTRRNIRLDRKHWRHVLSEHPYMSGEIEQIKEALFHPDKIEASFADENIRLYYKHQKTLSNYLVVVVKYLNGNGFVITAFFTNKIKKNK